MTEEETKENVEKENKEENKQENNEISIELKGNPFDVIDFALMTEKSVQAIELENKLVFITKEESSKSDIKKAVQSAFEKNVSKVNTMIDTKGRKKAFVKFEEEGAAADIAMRLGII